MTEATGEYWTFSAECCKPFGVIPRTMKVKCQEELTPDICLSCEFCDLTYVPDVLTFTPDFKVED